MPDSKFYTQDAAMTKAADIQTALAASKLRFFDFPFVPTESTTRADLVAVETTFDGYPGGGYDLALWSNPTRDPNGGAVITSPLVPVVYIPTVEPPVIGNLGGYWIEDANDKVREIGIYDPPRTVAVTGDGFQWVEQIVEARNS